MTGWLGGGRPRRSGPTGGSALGGKPGDDVGGDGSMEATIEELQEFLEADRVEVHADPRFKERLREKLWEMLRLRGRRRPGNDP